MRNTPFFAEQSGAFDTTVQTEQPVIRRVAISYVSVKCYIQEEQNCYFSNAASANSPVLLYKDCFDTHRYRTNKPNRLQRDPVGFRGGLQPPPYSLKAGEFQLIDCTLQDLWLISLSIASIRRTHCLVTEQ